MKPTIGRIVHYHETVSFSKNSIDVALAKPKVPMGTGNYTWGWPIKEEFADTKTE